MVILGAKDSVNCCRRKLSYGVAWRQRKLVITGRMHRTGDRQTRRFSWVEGDRERLLQCLLRSSVKLVLLAPDLPATDLQLWAELGQRAHKPVYLRLRSTPALPERARPLAWVIKGGCDRLVACLLLAILSPLLLIAALLIGLTTPGAIFSRRWHVGKRGRLFKLLTFRCTEDALSPALSSGSEAVGSGHAIGSGHGAESDAIAPESREPNRPLTPIGSWLCRYGIDRWPQLLNVLLGQISLVGPQARSLTDLAQISATQYPRLNIMPGMTGAWTVVKPAEAPDGWADLATPDLLYTTPWSLRRDLGDLVRTIPRTFQKNVP